MKYSVGDQVITLVERGQAKEGDVGCIDAIKGDRYLVGFYATEDALLASAYFFEEELTPATKSKENHVFIEGDVVETLVEYPSLPKLSVGKVVAEVEKDTYAVSFALPNMSIPFLFPIRASDLLKIGHEENHHHH